MRWLLLVAATLLPLACGGGDQQAKAPEPDDESHPSGARRKASEGDRSLADHRRAFMDGCLVRVPRGADYCECGWEQMQKTFSEAEMDSNAKPDESKLVELRDRTAATCLSKLPESNVREDFMNDCAGGTPDLGPYCECAWTELRKTLSVADFADKKTMQSRRFAEARKATSRKCGPKMPEQVVREEFMRGCLTVDVQAKTFCSCVWKTLRSKMSPGEIAAADAADLDAHEQSVRAACGAMGKKK